MSNPSKIFILPDCQVAPKVPLDHLRWAGQYVADKRPDIVVCLGDFADMESLCSYEYGTTAAEGRRLRKDLDVAQKAMEIFIDPIKKARGYNPRLVFCEGNHEERLRRLVKHDPRLDGFVSVDDLRFKEFGWEYHQFLKPVVIDGVSFSHYFPSGIMGRPCTSARIMLGKYHQSCIAGHKPGKDIAYAQKGNGKTITAVIVGSYYQHDEPYLNGFTNRHWRGCLMLHEVKDGVFDEMFLSLAYLKRRYK